jgi:glycosyltransferase involved in cell wall biosynthesis
VIDGRNLRVLYVINGLGTGGAERSLAELLPALPGEGIEPVVTCLYRRDHGVQDAVVSSGVDVRFLEPPGLPGRVAALRRVIRSVRPEVVHTTIFESDLVGRLAAAGTGAAVLTSLVNTSYDPIRLRDPGVRPGRLRAAQAVDAWTARWLTTHFHAITRTVKRAAVRSLGIAPHRITVIERGRDPARLGVGTPERRAAARAELGLPEDAEVLVTVGRHEFQKGHTHLLEAVRLLRDRRPGLVLLLAGRRGNVSAVLDEQLARDGLGPNTRLLGHREDVPEILAAGDVFVFPSLYEGLGGAVIEAMALGLPIVASDLEAVREVVEPDGNALLVRPGAAGDLAGAIGRVLDEPPLRRSFGERSRQIFDDRFYLSRSTAKLVRLYRWLGDGRRRAERVNETNVLVR